MDQGTVLGAMVEAGRRLLAHLIDIGVPVTGAAVLNEPDDKHTLYLVTPLVSESGDKLPAYHRVNEAIRSMPDSTGMYSLRYKVVSPSVPVGRAIEEMWRQYPRRPPVWRGGLRYGGVTTEDAYIYPPPDRLSAAQ